MEPSATCGHRHLEMLAVWDEPVPEWQCLGYGSGARLPTSALVLRAVETAGEADPRRDPAFLVTRLRGNTRRRTSSKPRVLLRTTCAPSLGSRRTPALGHRARN